MNFFFLRKKTKKKKSHLLWIPKRGKTPPNAERAKLFAARELAAKTGYASTKNVNMPEYTRMVLSKTKLMSVNDLHSQVCSRNQDYGKAHIAGRGLNSPGSKECTANYWYNPMHIRIYGPSKYE